MVLGKNFTCIRVKILGETHHAVSCKTVAKNLGLWAYDLKSLAGSEFRRLDIKKKFFRIRIFTEKF